MNIETGEQEITQRVRAISWPLRLLRINFHERTDDRPPVVDMVFDAAGIVGAPLPAFRSYFPLEPRRIDLDLDGQMEVGLAATMAAMMSELEKLSPA